MQRLMQSMQAGHFTTRLQMRSGQQFVTQRERDLGQCQVEVGFQRKHSAMPGGFQKLLEARDRAVSLV